MTNDNIIVLGAGYTGMLAAIRVARQTRRQDVQVTLVNPSPQFTERLRMHQTATGQQLTDFRIPDLIEGTGIEFVVGWASAVDPDHQVVTVATANGDVELSYDHLIYAIGSAAKTTTVPGAETHAYTLDTPQSALALAIRLGELEPGGTVTVAGNGLTGLEAATEIAESHPHLRVVLLGRDVPAVVMGDKARAYVDKTLQRLGVEIRSGVEIVKVLPDAVELSDGELVYSDACLWTTGFWASPLAADSGLAVDERGRIVVDGSLRSISHPSVLATGDAAAIQQAWGVVHGTCQSGMPTAVFAADTIARLIKGKGARRFRFGYIHQPVSLGRNDAVIQWTKPDDRPGRWCLKGKAAVAYKNLVTSSPPKVFRMSRRLNLPQAIQWRKGGRATRPRPEPLDHRV
jgi:NADH dehydrogenase FAD-containing subunit